MIQHNDKPLFSVFVITYNSSAYLLDALESVKRQTYPNIELIISDDCSSDNSVVLAEKWVKENESRFVRTQIITTHNNTGIPKNCNRALFACTGEYVKPLSGDDVLFDDALENFYNFFQQNDSIKFCFGNTMFFEGDLSEGKFHTKIWNTDKVFFGAKVSAKRQLKILSHMFVGSGANFCYHRQTFVEIGGYDERYPLQEDYPSFVKITKTGFKIHLLKKHTLYYRKGIASVSLADDKLYFSKQQIRYIQEYKFQHCYENLNTIWRHLLKLSLSLRNKIINSGNSPKSTKSKLYFIVYKLFDPFLIYEKTIIVFNKLIAK